MRRITLVLIVALAIIIALRGHYNSTHSINRTDDSRSYISRTDTITIDDQNLFYAVEGCGKTIVLLHGNGGSHCDLETTQRQLAQAGYRVYALDSRGQGANKPLDEYHYADMAEDTYQFITKLGIVRPAVFGWSDGGIVALMMESMHPGTCSIIVTSGANITADNAIDPVIFDQIFSAESLSPLTEMMRNEPTMTESDIARIECPTLVCAGEYDLILPEHSQLIADLLPDGTLYTVEGHDHGSHIWHNTLMGDIIIKYLREHDYK